MQQNYIPKAMCPYWLLQHLNFLGNVEVTLKG